MRHATQENVEGIEGIGNLFLAAPDKDFHKFLGEIDDLVQFCPEILAAIDRDLNDYAKEKKKIRLADKLFFQGNTSELPLFYPFLAPSRRLCLECVIGQMKEDLSDLHKVIGYTTERIVDGKQLKHRRREKAAANLAA